MAATYLASLLAEGVAVGLPAGRVTQVELQRAAFGDPMDDLVIKTKLEDDSSASLALQIKRRLQISASRTNRDFHDVVSRGWSTIRTPSFRAGIDRIGAAVGSIAEGNKRAVQDVCEWARVSPTYEDFEKRFVHGASGAQHRAVRDAFAATLTAVDASVQPRDLHRLLASFVLVTFDLIHEGASDEAHAIDLLGRCLSSGEVGRAGDLFARLTQLAQDASGRAGQFTRTILLNKLRGSFRFTPGRSYDADLARLSDETRRGIAEIDDTIDGLHIPRTRAVERIAEALKECRFVQISGLPGCGKSVVLRRLVEAAAKTGPVLLLKADRLQSTGWNGYVAALGLRSSDLNTLLIEIAATGVPTLFIDGLDRIEVEHRAIVNDVLTLLADTPDLKDWRVVATVRDNGLEPLRTWLSRKWLAGGASIVNVPLLDDDEAEAVTRAHPRLRPLLFGAEQLRELMRRPFFPLRCLPTIGRTSVCNGA